MPRPFKHRPPFHQPSSPQGSSALSEGEYYYDEQDLLTSSNSKLQDTSETKVRPKPPPKAAAKGTESFQDIKKMVEQQARGDEEMRQKIDEQAKELEKMRLQLEIQKNQNVIDKNAEKIKKSEKDPAYYDEVDEPEKTIQPEITHQQTKTNRNQNVNSHLEYDAKSVHSIQDWNEVHGLNHLSERVPENHTGTEIHGKSIELSEDENLFCRNDGKDGIPSVLVIGAMKAGTTTFWSVLKEQTSLSEGKRKESKFFGQKWWEKFMPHRDRPLETPTQYAKTFGPCDSHRHYIDATPLSSVLEANPIKDIQSFYTPEEQDKLVFLMIMQEPVHRFVSQYNFQRRPNEKGRQQPVNSLREKLNPEINAYVEDHFISGEEADFGLFTRNNYGDIIEAYRDAFPKAKIILVQSDYFFGNEQAVMDGIIKQLGKESSKIAQAVAKNINHMSKALLSAKNHDQLADKWRPQIEKLRNIVENDESGLIGIYPENLDTFIDGLIPWKYCHRYEHTEKKFTENVLPIPTEDANDPKVTADYIYNKYYKFNLPFLIKNAAQNLFDNYMEINTNFILNQFDLTDRTHLNEGSGRIVNLGGEKSIMECLLEDKRCVYFRKFHFVKDQDGVRFPSPGDNHFLRPMHRYFSSGMKDDTFLWGVNTTGTYNLHISNRGGALPHSHSQAINILHQGAKRWILVNSRAYNKCEDQIDFELHKMCPVTGVYKKRYSNGTSGCTFTSEQWINSMDTIEFKHYDFVQEAGDLVFVPMTYTHGTIDLCAPTIGNVFMGGVTAFQNKCLEPEKFKHQPCEDPTSLLPNSPKCMEEVDGKPGFRSKGKGRKGKGRTRAVVR